MMGSWMQISRDSFTAVLAAGHLGHLPAWMVPPLTWTLLLWGGIAMTLIGVGIAIGRELGQSGNSPAK